MSMELGEGAQAAALPAGAADPRRPPEPYKFAMLAVRQERSPWLASAAEAAGCKLILTRNVADFGASPVPAVTPEEFLLAGSQA